MTQLDRSYDGIKAVRVAVNDFRERRRLINDDRMLSAFGKAQKTKALDVEIDAYRRKAWNDLDLELRLLRRDKKRQEVQALAADTAEAERWDAARLAYLGMEIQNKLRTAATFEDAQRVYQDGIKNTDPHTRRAWFANAPGMIHERFSHDWATDVGRLEKHAAGELQRLTSTPEKDAAEGFGEEIAARAQELVSTIDTARQFYGLGGLWSAGDEFSELAQNITVTQSVHPDEPSRFIEYHVEISDPVLP